MPMTPFIGVRISWLMLARNSDFSRTDPRRVARLFEPAAHFGQRSSHVVKHPVELCDLVVSVQRRRQRPAGGEIVRVVAEPLQARADAAAEHQREHAGQQDRGAVPATSSQLNRCQDMSRTRCRAAFSRISSSERAFTSARMRFITSGPLSCSAAGCAEGVWPAANERCNLAKLRARSAVSCSMRRRAPPAEGCREPGFAVARRPR